MAGVSSQAIGKQGFSYKKGNSYNQENSTKYTNIPTQKSAILDIHNEM